MDVPRLSRRLFAPLLAVSLAATSLQAAAPVDQASGAETKAYGKLFAKGKRLFKQGEFQGAIEAFQGAHDVVSDPEALLMIARAHTSLGELRKAHAAYLSTVEAAQSAVHHGEKYRDMLQAAEKELKDLESVSAWVTIVLRHAPTGTDVTIEGDPVPAEKLGAPLLLPPGPVNIVATTPDGREVSRQVTLNAGERSEVDLAFVRHDDGPIVEEGTESEREPAGTDDEAAPAGSGSRTAAFIAGGVGIAGLATFGVFGAMSNSKFDDLEEACVNDRCDPSRAGDIDDGKLFQTVANVGLVVGVVGVGTSAALFIFGGSGSSSEPESAALSVGVGPSAIRVRGRF